MAVIDGPSCVKIESESAKSGYNAPMRPLTLFGLFAVGAMLVFYALEPRRPIYVLGFAAGCALASVYGFLQGAWPFGVVEAIWVIVAVRRWRDRRRCTAQPDQG